MKNLLWIVIISSLTWASCSKKADSEIRLPEVEPPTKVDPPIKTPDTVRIPEIDADVQAFMSKHDVPGVSLAITRYGKLVYARGYGYAEKEAVRLVDTSSLFRIASVTKFTTATAIMKLVEAKKLTLDDKVFGPGALLGTRYGTPPYKKYVTDITVRHLLQHTCGGWGNSSSDPMFAYGNMDVHQLFTWMLDNRELVNAPGTVVDYSNAGYIILGRVIEKLSGKTYPDFMQQEVFGPSGIKNMQIAGSTYAERKVNEVKYYGYSGSNPYGYGPTTIPRLDACGGWIASAIDITRLLVRIDGSTTVPDILQPSSIITMTTPFGSTRYGFGLMVASGRFYHGGALAGTRTRIFRSENGFTWCILTNHRPKDETQFDHDLDYLVFDRIFTPSIKWPDRDLF